MRRKRRREHFPHYKKMLPSLPWEESALLAKRAKTIEGSEESENLSPPAYAHTRGALAGVVLQFAAVLARAAPAAPRQWVIAGRSDWTIPSWRVCGGSTGLSGDRYHLTEGDHEVSNVVEFNRTKSRQVAALKVAEQAAPQRLSDITVRGEWDAALAAIWSNPKNWKRSRQGNAYIAIDDLGICVVVERDEHGFQWEIRWRSGRNTVVSRWIYMSEQTAINEAWDAVCVLG